MRIAICDDMKTERQKIKEAVKKVIEDASISEFNNGKYLVKSHSECHFDLIFLDIIMPEISGIDTAAEIRKTDSVTPVVFVSTSEEFGVASYRVLAFDYILKPIREDVIRACIKRLFSMRKENRYIKINYSGIETKILLSNIQCVESNLRKVIFTLSENREIQIVGKLTDYEKFLIPYGFCRCHKSYIVNIEHIDSIDGENFHLTGGKTVKISRAYLQSAKKAYFDYVFASEDAR